MAASVRKEVSSFFVYFQFIVLVPPTTSHPHHTLLICDCCDVKVSVWWAWYHILMWVVFFTTEVNGILMWTSLHSELVCIYSSSSIHFKLCISSRERKKIRFRISISSRFACLLGNSYYGILKHKPERESFHAEIWVEYQAKCNANSTPRTKLPKSCQNTFSFQAYHRVNRCVCKKERGCGELGDNKY